MRRMDFATVAGVVVFLLIGVGAYVTASDGDASSEPRRSPSAEGPRRPGPQDRTDRLIQRFNREVQPTEAQQAKLGGMWTQYKADLAAWDKANGAKMRESFSSMRTARRSGDSARIAAMQKQSKELQASRQAINDALLKKMEPVLRPDQMVKARQVLSAEQRGPMTDEQRLQAVGLTAPQKVKVKMILDDARIQAAKTDDEALKASLQKDAMTRILETVLTEEQRTKYAEASRRPRGGAWNRGSGERNAGMPGAGRRRGGNGPGGGMGVNLSDEQRQQMQTIWTDARSAAQNAKTPEERQKIFAEAREKANAVYTDEQRQQLRERMQRFRSRTDQ